MVSHDLDYVRQHCPKSLLLARERIDFGNTEKVLTVQNLSQAQRMSEAFDLSASCCNKEVA